MALQNGPEDHLPQMLQEFSQAHKQMQQLNSLFRKATPEAVQFFHDRRVTFVNNILTIGGHVLDLNRGENTEIYFAVNGGNLRVCGRDTKGKDFREATIDVETGQIIPGSDKRIGEDEMMAYRLIENPSATAVAEAPGDIIASMEGLKQFGLSFSADVLKNQPNKNVSISPMGMVLCLCLAYKLCSPDNKVKIQQLLGLSTDGDMTQLEASLKAKFDEISSIEGMTLRSADAIIGNMTIDNLPANIDLLPLDQGKFNEWVSKHTDGKITEMEVDMSSPLSIANALFFDGKWQSAFMQENRTREFTLPSGDQKSIGMMKLKKGFATAQMVDGSIVVKLPYKEGMHALVIIPAQGLDTLDISSLPKKFSYPEQETEFIMPEFEFESLSSGLLAQLEKMGLTGLDLAGFPVDTVSQKVYMKTDKDGSTAAAVTVMMSRSIERSSEIVVDKPFMFIIADDDGNPYFLSNVTDPQGGKIVPSTRG